ncbi:VOC family protein [uncultured Jatrophihabitans sp.]|uniref:VOC family protein n=1 Tax=uncultured Jatrophihabitans sp. TaxID=1610747 RepID=UPI0035CBA505
MRSAAALDHVTITTDDFARSAAFYDAALGALGMTRLRELVDEEEDDPVVEAAAWGADGDRACVWLVSGTTPTTGLHLQLRVESRVEVETFFAEAVAHGGVPHFAPRRWTPYRRGEFQAIARDPGGNLVEACSAE